MTVQQLRLATASALVVLMMTSSAMAQRGRGGGGGGGGGGRVGGMVSRPSGGGGGGGGNFARPSAPQNVSRPANLGNFNTNNVNRPTNVGNTVNRGPNTNVGNNVGNRTNTNINQNLQNFNRTNNLTQNNLNRTNINQNNFNRTNNNVVQNNSNNRQTVINNNVTNVTNVNNRNQFNNVNNGRYWGAGGYGSGVHANTYYGYHSSWVNGSWGGSAYRPYYGGYRYGGWGGYYGGFPHYGYGYGYGYGGPGWGYGVGNSALGIGVGIGVAAWGIGSLFNNWGYTSYVNPYYNSLYGTPAYVATTPVYNYSTAINLAAAPPADNVVQSASGLLDQARNAFRAGDYNQALALADKTLTQTPNDPIAHEFRATTLFALRRYDEAAVPFYTVLSVGPGWDWTTLVGLYPDVDTYTSQLRALEAYCNANPRAASARFVLASLYLTQGSTGAAVTRFREVVELQPQDKLSAQLVAALDSSNKTPAQGQPTTAVAANTGPSDTPPANPTPAPGQENNEPPPLPSGPVPTNLVGSWTSSPSKNVSITLTIGADKNFSWKVVENGQAREFKGEPGFDGEKNILALAPPDMPPMVGEVSVKDPSHFNFKAVGAPSSDPGLDFTKS